MSKKIFIIIWLFYSLSIVTDNTNFYPIHYHYPYQYRNQWINVMDHPHQFKIMTTTVTTQPFIDWQRSSSKKSSTYDNQKPSWNCCLWMSMTNTVTHFGNPNCLCFIELTLLPNMLMNPNAK